MGASECHIPGIIAEKCSWVGVIWAKEKTEIIICRALPVPPRKSNEETYYAIGTPVAIPASAANLNRVTNTDGALRRFEQLLLMGEVVGETFNEREGKRISFRNALPYVLVSDDIIIDKISLLRGMNDEHRQSIIESIPYFLGAVEENTAAAEIRLKRLRTQRDKEERKREAARTEEAEALAAGAGLLQEAIALGMIEPPAGADNGNRQALQLAAAWAPGLETDVVGQDSLAELYARERGLLNTISRARSRLAAARDVLDSANGFNFTVQQQRRKLDVRSIFRSENERDTCPICDSSLADRTVPMRSILDALEQLDGDLKEVEQDRPQIDGYIARLEAEVEVSTASLPAIREQISAIVRESEANAQRLELDQRRMRVAGRVSYFLESMDRARAAVVAMPPTDIDAEIRELEGLVDPEAKAERLNALQLQISGFATQVLKDLPFDETYRDVQVMFDAKKVKIQFVRGSRVYDMRQLGGDESYLSGRISALFGLHRLFAEENRPVPGVLIFDQISRPFYSPEKNPGQVRIDSTDRTDLKQYFDVLFQEVENQKTLQIIVFEHAYFPDDDRYTKAVKREWGPDGKLIPFDWPTLNDLVGSTTSTTDPQLASKDSSVSERTQVSGQIEVTGKLSDRDKAKIEWLFKILSGALMSQSINASIVKHAKEMALNDRRVVLLTMPEVSADLQVTMRELVDAYSNFLKLDLFDDPSPTPTNDEFNIFELRLRELRATLVGYATELKHKFRIQVPTNFQEASLGQE